MTTRTIIAAVLLAASTAMGQVRTNHLGSDHLGRARDAACYVRHIVTQKQRVTLDECAWLFNAMDETIEQINAAEAATVASNLMPIISVNDMIRGWAKDGTICKAMGHAWQKVHEDKNGWTIYHDIEASPYRKCRFCGKHETRYTTEEWR
jgi:hypothetical protein